MKEVRQEISYTTYESDQELPAELQHLVAQSKKATANAYSDYSGFSVGAAILLTDGTIVLGANQENIAYPSGLCAERAALFTVGSTYPKMPIQAIAITAKSMHGTVGSPVTPCGGCRQVMIEFESKQSTPIQVIMTGESGEVWVTSNVETLVPLYFSSNEVGKAKK